MPHNALGEVDQAAYRKFFNALRTGQPDLFDAIPLGGTAKLANPQAAYAFSLEGPDSHHLEIPAAPTFAGPETAGEMAEVYWQALTRDVPFTEYGSDPLTVKAAADLSALSDFKGPTENGAVTPATLFRGNTPGDLAGPYLSQFLWLDIPYGLNKVRQMYRVPVADVDFMTDLADWLDIQNGKAPTATIPLDPTPRYISTGRGLSEWVHRDFPYQAFLDAALLLLSYGPQVYDPANPYLTSSNQGGFVTFGAVEVLDLVVRVAREALKASWYQKWLVHRRLRPEAFAGNVHLHVTGAASYPIHEELLQSQALQEVGNKYGTYLLPMAYPEGSPTHPAYPAGHAAIAGACATILKAFFKEDFPLPNPVEASADGLSLIPITETLTIGGELNKLASNCALGRDTAGVHWRSDGIEGLILGEKVAIGLLNDYRYTFNEDFAGFSLTKFDGEIIVVGAE